MAKTARIALRIWGISILLFGLIFATIGGGFIVSSIGFTQRAVATTGIVTDIQILQPTRAARDKSGPTFKPTIRYLDQDGIAQSGQTYLSSTEYNFQLGTELGILYDPALPRNIRINSWFSLWGFGSALLFMGGLVMAIGAMIIKRAKGNRPYRPKTASITEESLAARKVADAKKQAANHYSSNDAPINPTVRRK